MTRQKLIKSGADELVIPLEVKSRAIGGSDPREMTITIDERSLRINEGIKEEAFQLDPMGAADIIDGDVERR